MNPGNAGSPKTKELSPSDIVATAASVIGISKVESSAWSHGGEYVVHPSIVIEFANQAAHDGPDAEPTVAASLTFKNAEREILQITGGWIDSPSAVVQFKAHEHHKLLIGSVDEGRFVAVEHAPAAASEASRESHRQIRHPLSEFHHGLVCVTLTDVRNQRLLYDSCFEIGINPLRVSQSVAPKP